MYFRLPHKCGTFACLLSLLIGNACLQIYPGWGQCFIYCTQWSVRRSLTSIICESSTVLKSDAPTGGPRWSSRNGMTLVIPEMNNDKFQSCWITHVQQIRWNQPVTCKVQKLWYPYRCQVMVQPDSTHLRRGLDHDLWHSMCEVFWSLPSCATCVVQLCRLVLRETHWRHDGLIEYKGLASCIECHTKDGLQKHALASSNYVGNGVVMGFRIFSRKTVCVYALAGSWSTSLGACS